MNPPHSASLYQPAPSRSSRRQRALRAFLGEAQQPGIRPVDALLDHALDAVGAGVGAFYRVPSGAGLLLAGTGRAAGTPAAVWPPGVAAGEGLAGRVAAGGEAVFVDDADDAALRRLHLPGPWPSWLAVPIVQGGSLFGVMVAGAAGRDAFDADAELILPLLAGQAAAAMGTSELEAAERRSRLGVDHARRHLALVAQGSRALVASLDDETVALQGLAAVVVPSFADWCTIDLVAAGGTRRVAAVHADAPTGTLPPDLLAGRPGWDTPVRRVAASGASELVVDVTAAPAHPDDADHLALLRALGLSSAVVVPIRAHGQSLGAITCATGTGRRGYRPSDVAAVEELAARTAVALERISLYESVKAGEAHLRALFEASPLAILEVGGDGRVRRANTAAVRLLGGAGDGAVAGDGAAAGGDVAAGLHPDTAALLSRLAADIAGGRPLADVEVLARRADGSDVPLSLTGAPLRAAGGVDGTLILAADVTARRLLEEQLGRVQRIEAAGQMAGGVAHDFNNLLTVILGHAALLAAALPDGDWRRADVAAITMAAERAAGVTSQLLTISRGDVPITELFDVRHRLRGLADDTVRSLLPERVELAVAMEPGDGLVRMSPAQFDQVVLNLAVNARDAIAGDGRLSIRLWEDGRSVVIQVTDDGSGMDAATAEHCFEPFFSTKGSAGGTGLGLATVHSILTGVGGGIDLSTAPGRGTTFTLRLPLVAGEVAAPSPDSPAVPTGSGRILLVEDEPGLRRLALQVLREAGYEVTPADDGQAALDALDAAGAPPDLLVTDVVMPRLGGVDLADRLASRHPDVPVLFMTGYVDQTSREGLVGADVLLKPFVVTELVTRVRQALDRAAG